MRKKQREKRGHDWAQAARRTLLARILELERMLLKYRKRFLKQDVELKELREQLKRRKRAKPMADIKDFALSDGDGQLDKEDKVTDDEVAALKERIGWRQKTSD